MWTRWSAVTKHSVDLVCLMGFTSVFAY